MDECSALEALLMSEGGWRVSYLDQNLPLTEKRAACSRSARAKCFKCRAIDYQPSVDLEGQEAFEDDQVSAWLLGPESSLPGSLGWGGGCSSVPGAAGKRPGLCLASLIC